MADELRLALTEVLRKAGVEQADFLREGVRVLAQELMEMELAERIGAERHERTPERNGYRNGYRERPGIRAWARSSCRCRESETAASFRVCWSRDAAPSEHWWLWFRRRTCRASRHVGSMTWCRRSVCRASARARSAGCAPNWIKRSSASERANSRGRIRTCGWMARSSKCATTAASSHKPSSSPLR